jgi:hypothetical protein
MEEEGSFEMSIDKSYIFYVGLISIVTGYALDDRISIPDRNRVSFFTSATSRLILGSIQTPAHRVSKAFPQE